MWERGEKIGCNYVDFYIRIQRVLFFMDDLINKSKLHE